MEETEDKTHLPENPYPPITLVPKEGAISSLLERDEVSNPAWVGYKLCQQDMLKKGFKYVGPQDIIIRYKDEYPTEKCKECERFNENQEYCSCTYPPDFDNGWIGHD